VKYYVEYLCSLHQRLGLSYMLEVGLAGHSCSKCLLWPIGCIEKHGENDHVGWVLN